MAEEPQSPSGDQGTETTDESGYAQYLDSVSPEIREQVEPLFKEFDGNVTKKFQEHAEYRKGWAPYEEAGIKDVPPETLQELLAFAQMASDPNQSDQFNDWLKNVATERGVFGEGQDDLDLEDVEDLSTDKIQELIAEQVAEKVGPIQEKFQAQETERLEQEASQAITQQLEEIRKDNPDLPEGAEDAIVRLAYSYADEDKDPIAKGLEDYKALIGQGEKSLFAQKDKQPQTPEGPGAASTAPEAITQFGDPRLKAQALERLKQS